MCGGLGSLHAIALPSFGESQHAERGRAGGRLTWTPTRSPPRSTRSVGSCGPTAADLVLVEADPKTLRVRLELQFDDVSCEECILPPDQLAETINAAISRRVPGRVRAAARRPAPLTGAAGADDDDQQLWSALVDVYQPVLRDVVDVLERDAGIDSGTYSALAYLDRAGRRMRLRELHDLMRVRYSQPGLSRLVQRMEADGIVERRGRSGRPAGHRRHAHPRRPRPVPARPRGLHGRARRAPRRATSPPPTPPQLDRRRSSAARHPGLASTAASRRQDVRSGVRGQRVTSVAGLATTIVRIASALRPSAAMRSANCCSPSTGATFIAWP